MKTKLFRHNVVQKVNCFGVNNELNHHLTKKLEIIRVMNFLKNVF